MESKIQTIREYRRGDFRVELAEHIEYDHPAGTISWPDQPEKEAEYIRKIETGEYPWYCLGVHVFVKGIEIGTSYLGWCDTYDLRALSARGTVHDAIQEARHTLATLSEASRGLNVNSS